MDLPFYVLAVLVLEMGRLSLAAGAQRHDSGAMRDRASALLDMGVRGGPSRLSQNFPRTA